MLGTDLPMGGDKKVAKFIKAVLAAVFDLHTPDICGTHPGYHNEFHRLAPRDS